MDSSIHNLENHEFLSVMGRMSSSGQLQLLRTTMIPEASELAALLYRDALKLDPAEWLMRGMEIKNESTLAKYRLLDLFRQTQRFEEYGKARESTKQALTKLSLLKQARTLSALTPCTPEFDIEYFFLDFVPGSYSEALIYHQGTVADAAGRGDLDFFKRLYNKVKNDQGKKAGGQYEHFLATFWLHGFFWLMPDRLGCRELARRMGVFYEAAERKGLEGRKSKRERKLSYASGVWHESQRKRFREAVKSLSLYQHPESPLIEARIIAKGEPNTNCYVWKNGWPK